MRVRRVRVRGGAASAARQRDNSLMSSTATVLVTTEPKSGDEASARRICEALCGHGVRATFAPRRSGESIAKMLAAADAADAVVVGARGAVLRRADGTECRLHGGMGVLRVRTLQRGERDPLVDVCGLREGDTFVDATAGQLSDALVAAHAVGATGRVLAMESSPLLWAVTSLRPARTGQPMVDALLTDRVAVALGDHTALLAAMPADSADVVYFDPMYQAPAHAKHAPGFEVVRAVACAAPLSAAALAEARRVARRRVVVKDQRGGAELERLGLRVEHEGPRQRFGVLDCAAGGAAAEPARKRARDEG